MKIVFLDSSTLHSGELDLVPLSRHGELISYPITSPEDVNERCVGAHTIISNKVVVSADTMAACPELKQIISCATGVNQIDIEAAKSLGITVQNVAGYSTHAVAQHVWSMILNLAAKTHLLDRESVEWPDYPIFTTLKHPIFEVSGKTLGIVGLGEIGEAVAEIGKCFGMEIIALSRTGNEEITTSGVKRLPKESFYAAADIISLHCPLAPETEGMISAETLAMMKSTAILINTARGPLINEQDLADALSDGTISAAGLDVLSTEPPAKDNPLVCYRGDNLMITPHTAWSAIEARQRLLAGLVENIDSFLAGTPSNLIV